jgi:pyruvate ferredoxin oxidoreductase alpha subunit
VIVLEKALAVGIGGIVAQNIHAALEGAGIEIHTAIAGLGGRPITKASVHRLVDDVRAGRADRAITFVDLNRGLVERELQRAVAQRRSGPHAENMLRDLGTVASAPV